MNVGLKPNALTADVKVGNDMPQTPIIPGDTVVRRALVFVIASMSLLACIALAVVITAHRNAERWSSDIAEEITVQLVQSGPLEFSEMLSRSLAILQSTDGVERATALTENELQSLLEPWLGDEIDFDTLPVPGLIRVEIDRASPPDFQSLAARLDAEVPGAVLDDHAFWLDRLQGGARIVVWIGGGLFFLVLSVMIASVVFATRAAVSTNQEIVDVLNLVGANESFIAFEFQRHFLVMGLKAGFFGCLAAVVMLLVFDLAISSWASYDTGGQTFLISDLTVDPLSFAGVAAIVFVVSILSAVTSRLAVSRYLSETGDN